MTLPDFETFPKIPRWNRDVIITEKIDGTNAQVLVTPDGYVIAGSRKRYLTESADNFGFAAWVEEHADELVRLGPGRHYGEWWGQGIQRGYGLVEKRFSLFHTHGIEDLPHCVHVVPRLLTWCGDVDQAISSCLHGLVQEGSVAAPGYMKPEGIVIYHTAARQLFKVTLEDDAKPKGL